jgi:SAM-dependent methyltransferase
MPKDDWWNEFFSIVWPRIQATGYPIERTASECDLIAELLRLQPGARVLDIPCGIGRHAVELGRRGFHVTGVDLKAEFIADARAAAATAGIPAEFLVSDMREFALPEPFDAAFCYFGSFGYFSGEGDARFLRAVARALRPGGRFLLDTHLMETLLPAFRERDWFWADAAQSRRVVEERTWHVETGRVEVTWTVHDDQGASSAKSSMRIYSFPELRRLLESVGFADVEGHAGITGGPLRLGSRRAAIVATLPAV